MLTSNIKFKNFNIVKKKYKKYFFKEKWFKEIKLLESLKHNYKYSYSNKSLNKIKKKKNFRLIGIGGSTLGAEAIYQFLKFKIKKNFVFINNLNPTIEKKKSFNNDVNIIISKSGNTLETILNSNLLIDKKINNIFLTENKDSYLNKLAKDLKAEIFEHKNYIGGRYSVLSEAGMLPAEIMGLNEKKFKRFNYLINNNNFLNQLILNVSAILKFVKERKSNSIILNYDEKSNNFFKWYQQLVAESLGKKSKGILPVISNMPKDNHSLLQLYLDGPKNNFFTFFYTQDKKSDKINNKLLQKTHNYLKDKSFSKIIYAQKKATEKIFYKKKIPFRSFEIKRRNEEVLGELFCFFILETILLGRALKVNPFDQPSVELIKKETKKILFN
jgi:glucose-6-phosphate isomerase|tara:strand:+ start:1394 stop:2551 length:1158 start_codon:yes stop_codon:yes gene_type:complete